jgi:hypothetical protein
MRRRRGRSLGCRGDLMSLLIWNAYHELVLERIVSHCSFESRLVKHGIDIPGSHRIVTQYISKIYNVFEAIWKVCGDSI